MGIDVLLKAIGTPGSASASRLRAGGLVVQIDELQLLSFQALSGSSLFVAQRLALRALDLVQELLLRDCQFVRGADPRYVRLPQPVFLLCCPCLLLALLCPAVVGFLPALGLVCPAVVALFRSFYRPSTCVYSSWHSMSRPPWHSMALALGFPPSNCAFGPHEAYASVSTLRETALLWQPSSRDAPEALSALTPRLPVVGAPDQAAAPPN